MCQLQLLCACLPAAAVERGCERVCACVQVVEDAELLERVGQTSVSSMFRFGQPPGGERSPDVESLLDDDFMMDMSDTLFSTLTQSSFPFPTHRELCESRPSHAIRCIV